MIAIIDYGMGNLLSVKKACEYIGSEAEITSDEKKIRCAQKIILPGVGAFPDAMDMLKKKGLDLVMKEEVKKGKNLLGICLGMQLLFEMGYEVRKEEGLGLIEGEIKLIQTDKKIPHMGWNSLTIEHETPLLQGIKNGDFVYFVHSFCAYVKNEADLNASCDYGTKIAAVVSKDNVYGTQFHPEKSSKVGLAILRNYIELKN